MPPPAESPDLAALLGELVRGGVDFVVVGGVAAVLHGAPITTRDLQTLIEIKAAAGRPKDRIVVPILLALLDERSPGE